MNNYLLTGAAPTPNGRLHLGHIGAQFLKLDILKRSVLRSGGKAALLFSVDAFDTPIYIVAQRHNVSETEVCDRYYTAISQDLENAAIDHDVFLNTSSGEGMAMIKEAADELDSVLQDRKVPVSERVPFSRRSGKPLTGKLLAGTCPSCDQ